MVDLLAAEADAVVRFQGGANAGHTIINDPESSFSTCFRPACSRRTR